MVTRIRVAADPSGVIYGVRSAGRKYNIDKKVISRWIEKGEVKLAGPFEPGAPQPIDESSLRKRISNYTPHRDNANRRRRSKTIPEMQAAAPAVNGNGVSNGHSSQPILSDQSPSTPVATAAPRSGEVLLLNTEEWVARFYTEQARSSDNGQLNAETKDSYDWTFDRFKARFKTLPMEPVSGRKAILDYIHGLTNLKTGGPLAGGSKSLAHRNLSTFYNWLKREYGYVTPNLTQPKIARRRTRAVAIWPNESRAVLKMARNHSEKTILVLLAQTAVRLGELCTIRPECLHDHWVEVWGKPTRANPTGYRQVPIPDEAYDDLRREFATYGQLVWVDNHGEAKPLAGPLTPAIPGRAIDMRNPETFRVVPNPDTQKAIQSMLRKLLKDAGVYELGKGAHSFRRAYQAEFVANGGKREFYRLIMGHFQTSDMDDLYTHATIETIVEQARKYAPRRFLSDEALQGDMASDADLKALDASSDDEDDGDE